MTGRVPMLRELTVSGGRGERETNHKRLLTIEDKLSGDGGRWVGDELDG